MGKIFCVMGKSASGKDSIYRELKKSTDLGLKQIIPYTTRPIRAGEKDGVDYIFCSDEQVRALEDAGKIIELRQYNTVHGIWKYFTVDDGQIDLSQNNYILIGTLEVYEKIRNYFGKDSVVPIYIEVDDGERLLRAISREMQQENPKYQELCRRFLADSEDFSEEKLKELCIEKRFINDDIKKTTENIAKFIQDNRM